MISDEMREQGASFKDIERLWKAVPRRIQPPEVQPMLQDGRKLFALLDEERAEALAQHKSSKAGMIEANNRILHSAKSGCSADGTSSVRLHRCRLFPYFYYYCYHYLFRNDPIYRYCSATYPKPILIGSVWVRV